MYKREVYEAEFLNACQNRRSIFLVQICEE
jgi:hypothetical protein